MRILVTNDDGVYSPGIAALARVARRFGDVRVVAPDVEQSSAGHAITASRPVRYRRTQIFDDLEAYRVNGTPADCVALGAHQWDDVDIVLSGINLGPNLGNATWHSGTLAAAKQAVLLGIRGVAMSAPVDDETADFSALEPWVERALHLLLEQDRPLLVNVNFPLEPRGMRWTAQAVDQYNGKVVADTDPMGREHYWFTVVPIERRRKGTDLWAFEQRYVSLTPLRLDLTDYEELAKCRGVERDARLNRPIQGEAFGSRGGPMPNKRPSVKNEKQYEKLKKKGMSKERAARIANSPGASSRGGKTSGKGGSSSQGGTTAQKKSAGRKGGKASARKS
jgi:5'-nucleotidase